MDKNPFKINLKWLILFLLLGFIGWQLYKPKPPSPPRLTLEERGYQQVMVAGQSFDECVCITSVEFPGVFFWAGGNDYNLGNEVKAGHSSAADPTSRRLKVYIHEDDLAKIGGLKGGMINGIKYVPVDC